MRIKSYNVLYNFYKHGTFLNLALKNITDKNMNQITKRVYGVVQNDIYFEYIINKFSEKKTDLKTKIILKLAIYEFLFLDSIPKYAIINEYINLVKEKNKSAVPFVSFILNNKLNSELKPEFNFSNEAKNYSLQYSIPQFFVKKIIKQYPINYKMIISDTSNIKKTYARVLSDKIPRTCETFVDELVSCDTNPLHMKEFENNEIIIQDLGSFLIGKICISSKYNRAYDLCAAPGNKSAIIAQHVEELYANEINLSRLKLLKENMEKYSMKNVHYTNYDATMLSEFNNLNKEFDLILVDAPCSGSGVFKSKPDLKINLTEENINRVLETQEKILNVASSLLNSGGILIYSTCSINKEENEFQIKKFIERNKFKEIKINKYDKYLDKAEYGYILWPYKYNSDGFYVCKMVKE